MVVMTGVEGGAPSQANAPFFVADFRLLGCWLLNLAVGVVAAAAFLAGDLVWAGVAVITALVSLSAMYWLVKGKQGNTSGLMRLATEIERGNLGFRLMPESGVSPAVAESLNAAIRSLVRVFSGFSQSAMELSSVARETMDNAAGGDEGVRRQRDVTVSSAASLEELSVSLQMSSEQAVHAAVMAEETQQLANTASGQVQQLARHVAILAETVAGSARTAGALGERSTEIGQIVDVIKNIAGQTNLLALNAAIEAARAGEQGRGFAVVADEVRKLAESTSLAAGEIGGLITGIRSEIGGMVEAMHQSNVLAAEGAAEASVAAGELDRVVGNTDTTLGLVRDIASACAEQTTASQRIAHDIEQIAQLADQNEHLVRDASDLSAYVDQLAAQLNTILKNYRLEA